MSGCGREFSCTTEDDFTEVVLDSIPGTDKTLGVKFRCAYAHLNTNACNSFCGIDQVRIRGNTDNEIIVRSTVTKEVAEALQSWFDLFYKCVCKQGFCIQLKTKGSLCKYYPSDKLKYRLNIEGVHPTKVSIEDSFTFPDRKDIEMTLHVDSFYLAERHDSPTPLFVSDYPHSVLYSLMYKDNFTNKVIYEVFTSLEDAELRRDEVSDIGASISELLINAAELE